MNGKSSAFRAFTFYFSSFTFFPIAYFMISHFSLFTSSNASPATLLTSLYLSVIARIESFLLMSSCCLLVSPG
jgi:hypothetical protein